MSCHHRLPNDVLYDDGNKRELRVRRMEGINGMLGAVLLLLLSQQFIIITCTSPAARPCLTFHSIALIAWVNAITIVNAGTHNDVVDIGSSKCRLYYVGEVVTVTVAIAGVANSEGELDIPSVDLSASSSPFSSNIRRQ